MLRATRPLLSALQSVKATTGITGLNVHPDPLPALASIYNSTLTTLKELPSTSVYRQATEAITQHRLKLVQSVNGNIAQAESGLGSMVEQAIEEAKDEQKVAAKMTEWKAWEPLEAEAPKDQWRYFDPNNE